VCVSDWPTTPYRAGKSPCPWSYGHRVVTQCETLFAPGSAIATSLFRLSVSSTALSPRRGGLSYTELEFEEALKLEKPILSFILNEEEYAKEKTSKAKTTVNNEFAKLDAFRMKASDPDRRHFRYFSNDQSEKLDVDYLIAVQEQASSMQEGGWVRYSEVKAAIELNDTIANNEFFQRYVDRLNTFPILSQRAGVGKDEKEAVARFFWDRYLSKLATWKMSRLFFESGSTLAYVGYEFSQRLRKPWVRTYIDASRGKPNNEFQVFTNNILIYIDFALAEYDSDPMRIKRYPVGPADPYYGATFGKLTSLIRHRRSTRNCNADCV